LFGISQDLPIDHLPCMITENFDMKELLPQNFLFLIGYK
jgi:hypothetical protein